MEDMAQMLEEMIGSEEGRQKLQEMAELLSNGKNGFDPSMLEGLLSGLQNGETKDQQNPDDHPPPDGDGIDLSAMLGLGKILSQMQTKDPNTELIRALKPLLRPERQKKADQAIQILRILSLLPLLRESGLLDNFSF